MFCFGPRTRAVYYFFFLHVVSYTHTYRANQRHCHVFRPHSLPDRTTALLGRVRTSHYEINVSNIQALIQTASAQFSTNPGIFTCAPLRKNTLQTRRRTGTTSTTSRTKARNGPALSRVLFLCFFILIRRIVKKKGKERFPLGKALNACSYPDLRKITNRNCI